MKHSSYDLPVVSVSRESHHGAVNQGFQADVSEDINDNTERRIPSAEESNDQVHADRKVNNAVIISDDEQDDDDDDSYCGIGSWRPTCMQGCKNMACFSALYCMIGLVMSSLNAYINSQITTLEKHFNFSSAISGFLMSCNDFGYLATTLSVSYYTRRVHIPRAMSGSSVLYGVSGLLCAMAFFGTRSQIPSPPMDILYVGNTTLQPAARTSFTQMCQNATSPANESCTAGSNRSKGIFEITEDWRIVAIFILAVGMIVQGFAKSPRQAFLTTYVDDNVPKTKTSMYLGVTIGMSIFGPGVAFALGGLFSSMYVTLEETNISPRDPRWLGAWWLGFLVFGSAGLIVSVPLIFFPKRMRRTQTRPPTTEQRLKVRDTGLCGFWRDTKDLFKSLLHLLANPVFMCLTFASVFHSLSISGVMGFLAKYLETQFTIPASRANMFIGAVTFTAAPLGTIVGGYLTSRFKLSPVACLKFVIICKTIDNLVSCLSFVFGCDQPQLYSGTEADSSSYQSTSQCLNNCHCDDLKYFPVCGSDGRSYFSPCHAGCMSMNNQIFTNCSCLSRDSTQTATGGLCHQACNMLYPYLAMNFVGAFTSTLSLMPSFIVIIRSVNEDSKPLAIGFNAFVSNLLGWFPGPVIFGILVDSTCLLWRSTCSSVGACSLYDIELFRYRFSGLSISLRTIMLGLYVIVLIYALYSKQYAFQPHIDNVSESVSPDETTKEKSTNTRNSEILNSNSELETKCKSIN